MKNTIITAAAIAMLAGSAPAQFPFFPLPFPKLPKPPALPPIVAPVIRAREVTIRPAPVAVTVMHVETRVEEHPAPIVRSDDIDFTLAYRTLSPHGDWFYHHTYGNVWRARETVTVAGWRPYCHGGRWIWTEGGWYWDSDYSWGSIPFHYGRWVWTVEFGWVWVPGTTWSPAWVHWRYSNSHCGWAPLPAGADFEIGWGFTFRGSRVSVDFDFGLRDRDYTFVPSHRFASYPPCDYMVRDDEAAAVYRTTTVIYNDYRTINNTTVYTGLPPTTVYRRGSEPPPRPIIRRTRQDMQDDGRLSRVLQTTTTSSPEPSGRIDRILRTTSAPTYQPAPAVKSSPAPQPAPAGSRVTRILSRSSSSSSGSAPARVSSTPAYKPAAPSTPAPKSAPAPSSSRVKQVRDLYNSKYRR